MGMTAKEIRHATVRRALEMSQDHIRKAEYHKDQMKLHTDMAELYNNKAKEILKEARR
jgi:hypothetical protein